MNSDEKQSFDSDFLHKMITRTDSYLNYANTKSTIIITFITAVIAAIGTHTGNAIHYLTERNYPALIVILKILIFFGVLLLLAAFYHAGRAVMPYTRPSARKNLFSFIDTIHHCPSEDAYSNEIISMEKDDVIKSMISLQYNLSAGLVAKYKMHRRAIFFILASFVPLIVALLILLFV